MLIFFFFQQNLSLAAFVCKIRSHLCLGRGEGEKHSDHLFSETIGSYFCGGRVRSCVLPEQLCWHEGISYMPTLSRGSMFLLFASLLTVMARMPVSTELKSQHLFSVLPTSDSTNPFDNQSMNSRNQGSQSNVSEGYGSELKAVDF